MEKTKVGPQIIERQGLTEEEHQKICKCLGREPNYTELGLFSMMWSEHCSYKNSKPVLRLLPLSGRQIIQGAGKNVGIIDLGDEMTAVVKIDSFNQPAAIEPFEASAAGSGSVIRDIFSTGAQTVGLLFSWRFGMPKNKKNKHFLKEINRGFSHYVNTAEVSSLGGEIYFDSSYEENPLLNIMAVGILPKKNLIRVKASNAGKAVYALGGAAGREEMSGLTFDSGPSTVAAGNPKLSRIIRRACLELIEKNCLETMQNTGVSGLVCSSSEIAYKGEKGIEIDISLVPRKSSRMTPGEIMLSESQERMLLILKEGKEELALRILNKWKAPLVKIGQVTDDGLLKIKEGEKVIAEVPARALVEAPEYHREIKTPAYLSETMNFNLNQIKEPKSYNQVLLQLLASVNIAGRQRVFNRGKPALKVAALKLPNTKKAVAWAINGNSTYCYLNPFRGGAIAVAEAARRLVCSGAKPLAFSNGLNFGNPQKPESFWQLRKCAEGISEACRQLNIPVASGNVSLNNESANKTIDPTLIVGMTGLIEDYQKIVTPLFKHRGDLIALIGESKNEIGGSEYLKISHGLKKGDAPEIDWNLEKKAQKFCLSAINSGLINSAHNCSQGGLAVALAESCLGNSQKTLGAKIQISDVIFNWANRIPQMEFKLREPIRPDALLFGESQSRIIISFSPANLLALQDLAQKLKLAFKTVGRVEGSNLIINSGVGNLINLPLSRLSRKWEEAFKKLLGGKKKETKKKPKKKLGRKKPPGKKRAKAKAAGKKKPNRKKGLKKKAVKKRMVKKKAGKRKAAKKKR